MTDTKHTPGPLHAVRQEVRDADENTIVTVPYGDDWEQAEAYARLFAAAPTMKGQLQTGIDALEVAIQLFIRKEDSEAFAALKGIIAGNEMAIAKAEPQ